MAAGSGGRGAALSPKRGAGPRTRSSILSDTTLWAGHRFWSVVTTHVQTVTSDGTSRADTASKHSMKEPLAGST